MSTTKLTKITKNFYFNYNFADLQALVVPHCVQFGTLLLDGIAHLRLQGVHLDGRPLAEECTAQGRGKEQNKPTEKRLDRRIGTRISLEEAPLLQLLHQQRRQGCATEQEKEKEKDLDKIQALKD